MKLLFALALFLYIAPAQAAYRFPFLHHTDTMQGSVAEPTKSSLNYAWKFSLLGLAGLGFLIRRRL